MSKFYLVRHPETFLAVEVLDAVSFENAKNTFPPSAVYTESWEDLHEALIRIAREKITRVQHELSEAIDYLNSVQSLNTMIRGK